MKENEKKSMYIDIHNKKIQYVSIISCFSYFLKVPYVFQTNYEDNFLHSFKFK
jgi:hypothetical protein